MKTCAECGQVKKPSPPPDLERRRRHIGRELIACGDALIHELIDLSEARLTVVRAARLLEELADING